MTTPSKRRSKKKRTRKTRRFLHRDPDRANESRSIAMKAAVDGGVGAGAEDATVIASRESAVGTDHAISKTRPARLHDRHSMPARCWSINPAKMRAMPGFLTHHFACSNMSPADNRVK